MFDLHILHHRYPFINLYCYQSTAEAEAAHTEAGINERDPETEIGRYAQWGEDERATPPVERGSGGLLGTASRYNSENIWRGTLALLYVPILFLVLTIWGWLHQLFGVPAWVAWASMAAVAVTLIVIAFRRPVRR